MGKYIVEEDFTQKVDPETGEVMQYTKNVKVVKTTAEPFFLTFSKEILALYGKSVFNVATKVFWKLLEFAEYNTGKVYMTAERRDSVLEICSISKSSYYRAMDELEEAGLIIRNRDTITINEKMFWKGDREIRNKLMKAKLQVTFEALYPEETKR